jgi:hypothetical protein
MGCWPPSAANQIGRNLKPEALSCMIKNIPSVIGVQRVLLGVNGNVAKMRPEAELMHQFREKVEVCPLLGVLLPCRKLEMNCAA